MAKTNVAVATPETDAVEPEYTLDQLKQAWAEASVRSAEADNVFAQAEYAVKTFKVITSRVLFLTATHKDVLTARTQKAGVNLTGALEALDIPVKRRTTFIRNIRAGEALKAKGLLHDGDMTEAITVVESAFDKYENEQKRIKREADKAKKIADELAGKGNESDAVDPDGQTSDSGDAAPADVALTADYVVEYVAGMASALGRYLADGGQFTVEQLNNIEQMLSEASASIS